MISIIKYWKYIVMFVLLFALTLAVNGCQSNKHDKELLHADIELMQSKLDVANAHATISAKETQIQMNEQVIDAERNANKKIQIALDAASDSAISVDRLSKQISDANKRMSTASKQTAIEYSTACNSILNSMAEAGGRISKSADGHAVDAERLDQSWPAPPDKPH